MNRPSEKMSAPVLPLDLNDLTMESNAAIVAAFMAFPDDEKWQQKYVAHARILEILNLSWPKGGPSNEEGKALLLYALEAPSTDELTRVVRERAERGYAAGMLLYNVCFDIRLQKPKPMTTNLRKIERAIWGRKVSDSKHIEEVVWRKFRPVASLWAAFIIKEPANVYDHNARLPCPVSELPDFLSLAEAVRIMGEHTIPRHRREPILRPGDSVLISEGVKAMLPTKTLTMLLMTRPA